MKKILIVEDDQLVANIYRNKFAVEGYRVEIALDGQAGLALMSTFKPDAVILDLMLPKITGVEVMKRIRAEPAFEKLPVIVFSNTYLTNLVQEAWKAGATKCLSKANCTPKQIFDVVRRTLSRNGEPVSGSVAPPQPGEAAPSSAAAGSAPVTLPPQPSTPEAADAVFQAGLRDSFLEVLPAVLTALRVLLQAVVRSDDEATRVTQLRELYRRVHSITANAGLTDLSQIAHMADALEVLLKELYENPKTINASTLRTVALAVDCLGFLFDRGAVPAPKESQPPGILVVDDEAISRRAVTYALDKARLKSTSVEDPSVALELLSEIRFDLVILDVDMPGMNGFEVCTKLRALPEHKLTPVLFVTRLNDFDTRTKSTMCGGNDFIVKPFLFIELAVKALVYVLRSRLQAVL
jgi:DNA-binding response OmpR family regulator